MNAIRLAAVLCASSSAFASFAPPALAQCEDETLTASDAAADDHFGRGVAVHDDTALVGAIDDDTTVGTGTGSAYFYERDTSGWNQVQKLVPTDLGTGDDYGFAVALQGDLAVVGAPFHDSGGTDRGAAYVFERSGGTWGSTPTKLTASDGAAGDEFGFSVSIVGERVLVGAPGDDSGAGSAYVFAKGTSGWSQKAKLAAPSPSAGDAFGIALDLSPPRNLITYSEDLSMELDCDFDPGTSDWHAGCHNFANGCTPMTTPPIYNTSHNSDFDSAVTDPAGGTGAWFVYLCDCAEIHGCVRKVGSYDTVHRTFEAWQTWSFFVRAGEGDDFSETFEMWLQDRNSQEPEVAGPTAYRVTWEWQTSGDPLAIAHTPSGVVTSDWDDVGDDWYRVSITIDGEASVALGHVINPMFRATTDTSGTVNEVEDTGIYVWGAQLEKGPEATPYQPIQGEPDLHGRTAAVGAMFDDTTASNAGAVHVLEWSSSGWALDATLLASDGEANDRFGAAVAVDRRTLFVGAPYEDEGGTNAGAVYVFHMTASGWTEVDKLVASDAGADLRFGSTVAVDRDIALVGAREDDYAGAFYVFERDPGTDTWSETEKVTRVSPSSGDDLGLAVALSRHTAIAGAFRADDPASEAGVAEVGIVGTFAETLCTCPDPVDPCGNDDADAGCKNSTGTGALLSAACSPSEDLDHLVLTATDLPANAACLLLMGEASQAPFSTTSDGALCITTGGTMTHGLFDFGAQTADGSGTVVFGPGIVAASRTDTLFQDAWIGAGKTWYFQYSYADASGPCGTGRNYSSGLAITFTP